MNLSSPPPALQSSSPVIDLRQVTKRYDSAAGSFLALQGIDMRVTAGEFVGVIGKSGSGKSTLINMITGIDRPTSGEVIIAGTPVHTLSEGRTAVWRGRNLGIVFQYFQLLPTLSLLRNVMLPMDFRGTIPRHARRERALALLERVGMAEHAHKRPAAVSGGQQQRAAIARALANDPPLLIADEPTGNLDSRTADSVFALFEELAREGKTVVMVTHDNDLARRVSRVIIVVDGQIVNQYVASALATLDLDQLSVVASSLTPLTFPPGAAIIRQGDLADRMYIITGGQADVLLEHPGGQEILVTRLGAGHYFGEIAVLRGGRRTATVRAAESTPVEVMALDAAAFRSLVGDSATTREEVDRTLRARLTELGALRPPH